jgi:signal recognition particle receptor subunit beta
MYLRGCAVVVLVCSTDLPDSIRNLDFWLSLARKTDPALNSVCVVLNKIDLNTNFDASAVNQWASEHQFMFFETSALDKESIERVFRTAADLADVAPAPRMPSHLKGFPPTRRCCRQI